MTRVSNGEAAGPEAPARRGWSSWSLSTRTLIGLTLGVLVGLFFGENAAILAPVADGFIRLLQMTVLPYVVIALMLGIGQLDLGGAKRLAVIGVVLLLISWGIGLLTVFLIPLTFPPWEAASFFSTALVEPPQAPDMIDVYIPSNPFSSLARGIVPATVLFSMMMGVALIGIERKKAFLDGLRVFHDALLRVMGFVVALMPLGVFAIGAVAAGTLTPGELVRLQVYMITFIVASLFLALWVLPGLIAAVTPFRYREVMRVSGEALLTAFLTQSLFVVLPLIANQSKELIQRHLPREEDAGPTVDVIVPISFTFPTTGKLLTLVFVPFAAWLSGSAMALGDYPGFLLAGLASYFAKAQVALPFLMDMFRIPIDLFQLYIPTSIINGKFDPLVSAVNLLLFALVGGAAMLGLLSLNLGRLLRYLAWTAVLALVLSFGTRTFLAWTVASDPDQGAALKSMRLLGESVPTTVRREALPPATTGARPGEDWLDQIKQRGKLRVLYSEDRFPLTFVNKYGDLVGLDVDLANLLARDLGVGLEFIPTTWDRMAGMLETGQADIAPGVPYLTQYIVEMGFSYPYLTGTLSFVTIDHRRHDFRSLDTIRELDGLKLGVLGSAEGMREFLRQHLPGVEFETVPLESPKDYFEGRWQDLDAIVTAAEIGTAWTLLHPRFTVVVPRDVLVQEPVGLAVATGQREFEEFLSEWLMAKERNGSIERLYDHWILGQGAVEDAPRWSIARDVLGWME